MDRWLACIQIAPSVMWHQSKPLAWWPVNKTGALGFYSSCSLRYHESGWGSATFPHPLGGKVLYSEGKGAQEVYRWSAVWDISHVPPRSPSLSERTAEALTFPLVLACEGLVSLKQRLSLRV